MAKPSGQMLPEDFHAMYSRGFRAAHNALSPPGFKETKGHDRLAADVSKLMVEYDDGCQLPKCVCSGDPTGRLSAAANSPEEAVMSFVKDRRDLWNLSNDDAATVEMLAVSGKGISTVRLIQRIEGKEIFNSDATAALSTRNEVVSFNGVLFPGTDAARSTAKQDAATSAEEAISIAASDLTNAPYDAKRFSAAESPDDPGPYRFFQFQPRENDRQPPFERTIRLKDVMFPIGEQQFVPGYYLELWIRGFPAFSYVIECTDSPEVLFRRNLSSGVAFVYRVFNTEEANFRPEDSPAPGTPHSDGVPNGFQAPVIESKLIAMESLLPGDPWLPANAEISVGNNCIAFADLTFPQGPNVGDVAARVTSNQVFDYRYDHARPATDRQNLQASLVGMFFHVNWLHDRWYEAGFDEASGNAQQDNFGRGGIGGDPILAEGNDFSGTNNANMATPADGSSPRMQMFVFNQDDGGPRRTSNLEALVTFHEMGHYVSNRLIGNASGLTNRQGRAMGEGWGDAFALAMTSRGDDDFANGCFAMGGWVLNGSGDNYYFGIRRYPYSADMTKNPLTFRHIAANVTLPSGPPRRPTAGGPNSFHNAGEVWCAALWEVFVNLVDKYGHQKAEPRMVSYLINGLKLTPSRPTYTQARDGVIGAISALDPSDLIEAWAGFAKRGMGVSAVSPPSSSESLLGVRENFDTP